MLKSRKEKLKILSEDKGEDRGEWVLNVIV